MSRPLNFLHLTTFYPPYSFGGDALYLYRLAHALGDAGHQVDIIHCVDAYHLLHPAEPEITFAEHPNVRRHELRSGYGRLSPLLTQQTGRPWLKQKSLETVLASRPYDVLHFHNISLLGPHVLRLNPPLGQAIKLYTTHEHWLICPTHVLWKFNERPCEAPECLRCTLQAKRPPQLWRYTDLLAEAAKQIDQFIAPSRFTAAMHAARGFAAPFEHLPLFAEPVAEQGSNARPHARPYFLFVGRLEAIKGAQTLLPLWERIIDCDLLLAGTGAEEAKLRAQAAHNPRVKFLGAVSQRDLAAYYAHAQAVLVPSLTYETFGMVIVEAFARRAPVIARDLGALPELIAESGGGFVYRTEEELLAVIIRLAAASEPRDELGARGYDAFTRLWTRAAHLERYFELLGQTARRKFGRVAWEEERENDSL